MADFSPDGLKAQLEEFNQLVEEWIEQAKEYFGQLNEMEKYGWTGEGVGLLLFLVGIVLFFI